MLFKRSEFNDIILIVAFNEFKKVKADDSKVRYFVKICDRIKRHEQGEAQNNEKQNVQVFFMKNDEMLKHPKTGHRVRG